MAKLIKELWAHSTHNSCEDQENGICAATHLKVDSSSWFNRSVWPLDWGWYPKDRLTVTPSHEQSSLQMMDVNWDFRSDMMSIVGHLVPEDMLKDQLSHLFCRGQLG